MERQGGREASQSGALGCGAANRAARRGKSGGQGGGEGQRGSQSRAALEAGIWAF